ncbi:DoxX-like family protein [Flavivirga sp. 57AJ16]|uniref:DoxX-like family protein n=1 Tax=Flavivirga sp. 57AJ16 TaxID=3025307 RepID=UPI002365C4B0|nr:DoxX-like family protein [Flavivirga sp. 57AJ16]MDD7887797.1 hypothetical protein [Flavivirga sp. 57AJ16]
MDFKLKRNNKLHVTSLTILKLSVFFVFLGRAYQHLFWDAPFRAFFWDEQLLKVFVESILKITWDDYVTSVSVDNLIQGLTFFFGAVYAVAAIIALIFRYNNRAHKVILLIGSMGLFILAYLLMKEQFYRFSQFFEYSLQFSIPVLLVYYKRSFVKKYLDLILKILIAVVFVAHALYAIGYYPVSGHFLDMTISITGFSEEVAKTFLLIAGVLDILVAILIFFPRVVKYVLIYAMVWGLLTSFARIVSGFYFDFFWESIHSSLYQVIYRLPHGLIPLMVLFRMKEKTTAM